MSHSPEATEVKSRRAADDVNQELRKKPHGEDAFAQIAQKVHGIQSGDAKHWNENLSRINKSVDMKALGFPSGMRITGADNARHLHGRGQDGTHYTFDKSGKQVDASEKEHSGNRDYDYDKRGAHRTVQKGDTLSGIASDMYRKNHDGKDPTAKEASEYAKKIAAENHIKDVNHLAAGHELMMPGERNRRETDNDKAQKAWETLSKDIPEIGKDKWAYNRVLKGIADGTSQDPDFKAAGADKRQRDQEAAKRLLQSNADHAGLGGTWMSPDTIARARAKYKPDMDSPLSSTLNYPL